MTNNNANNVARFKRGEYKVFQVSEMLAKHGVVCRNCQNDGKDMQKIRYLEKINILGCFAPLFYMRNKVYEVVAINKSLVQSAIKP